MSVEKTMDDRNKMDVSVEEYLLYRGQNDNSQIDHVFGSAFDYEEPHMQISKLQASILQSFIKQNNIGVIFEVGTFVGFSSFVMAKAISSDTGSVTSIEINEEFFRKAKENMRVHKEKYVDESITKKLRYICCDAKEYLLNSVSKKEAEVIDMFFLDGDKCNYVSYYDWVVDNMRSGSFFVIDNILFKGKVIEDTSNKYAKSIREVTKKLRDEDKFDYYFVPVGDCMLIAKKK